LVVASYYFLKALIFVWSYEIYLQLTI